MNRFAELIDALLFTPSRNGKLRLMQEYFATTPDPERGWALAALTGELGFAEAKPSQVRDLAMRRVDPELFGWSLDFVGDLAETVALIWPEESPHPDPPPLAGEGAKIERGENTPPLLAGEGGAHAARRGRVGASGGHGAAPTRVSSTKRSVAASIARPARPRGACTYRERPAARTGAVGGGSGMSYVIGRAWSASSRSVR